MHFELCTFKSLLPPVPLLDALHSSRPTIAVELRPPRAELATREGIDAWIDVYHSVRSLTRQQTYVFLTDSAVGAREEDNLRHLVNNLGPDAPRDRVVPFLTCKHRLDYCLAYAERARQHDFSSLVVLGGDRHDGIPRCVDHAWQLRQAIRAREPELHLGGWANPYAGLASQMDFLLAEQFTGEFFLTQIVTHHDQAPVARFLAEAARRGLAIPGMFGVFYYRSATPRTLQALSRFVRVPVEGLTREFASGVKPEEICARTMTAMMQLGARHFYLSNLPQARCTEVLGEIMEIAGVNVRI